MHLFSRQEILETKKKNKKNKYLKTCDISPTHLWAGEAQRDKFSPQRSKSG